MKSPERARNEGSTGPKRLSEAASADISEFKGENSEFQVVKSKSGVKIRNSGRNSGSKVELQEKSPRAAKRRPGRFHLDEFVMNDRAQ